MLWELHDKSARVSPKLGEAVAFRRLFDAIDECSLVDEVSIEAEVRAAGGELVTYRTPWSSTAGRPPFETFKSGAPASTEVILAGPSSTGYPRAASIRDAFC